MSPPYRVGLHLGQLADRPVSEMLRLARAAEDAGYELVLVPESWGRDAIAVLGAIAAATTTVGIGTGIVNVFSRSAALLAMAAGTLDELSGGRFVLGLGSSAPAVVEGWHGREAKAPLTQMREVTEAVRLILEGSRNGYQGGQVKVARGFALRFRRPRPRVPIWHAGMTPRSINLAGAMADGWLPSLLSPDGLRRNLEVAEAALHEAGRAREDLTVAPQILAAVDEDRQVARNMVRGHLTQYVGGMGRFYFEAFASQGFREDAEAVREEWTAGRREAALARLPDEAIDAVTLAGPAEHCRGRLAAYAEAGADLPVLALPSEVPTDSLLATIQALGPR